MALLTAPFDIGIKVGDEVRMQMAAVKIYQGGAVGVISGVGYATPLLIATAGMDYKGIAEETVDNSAGSAGDKWIRVRITGLAAFNLSGLTVANVGAPVYFVAGSVDNTVAAAITAVCAGELKYIDSAGLAWVEIRNATTNTNAPAWCPAVATVAAAGTTYATGGALVAGLTVVTAADGTKGVALPATPAPGTMVIVKNTVANQVLPIYPDGAAGINAIAAHAAISIAASTVAILVATSATQWYTIPLLPS